MRIFAWSLLLLAVEPRDPHPWIEDLRGSLTDIERRANAGDFEGAADDADLFMRGVEASFADWKAELETPRERRVLGTFVVFARDLPAALRRGEAREVVDALGRCRALILELRLAHEG